MSEDENPIELMKKSYDLHKVEYSIYEGSDRFYGTPIPKGYKAVLINDGFCPVSLQLQKIEK